jgi:HEAT repeat protein
MEVLPMSLALAEKQRGPMFKLVEKLPESLTLTNFRLRARAVSYGAKPDREALERLTGQLVELISVCRIEETSYENATFGAFSGFSGDELDFVTASVLPLLTKGDKGARSIAAKALGYLGGTGVSRALCELFQSGDADLIWSASEALSRIADEETLDCMLKALKSNNKELHTPAAITLGLIGSDRATDALIRALGDESFLVRWKSVEALGQIGGRRAMLGLLKALHDPQGNVRESVAQVLGGSGLDEVEAALVRTSSRRGEDTTRKTAVAALGWMGSERALTSLLKALKDKHHGVRCQAVRAIGRIGGELAATGLVGALGDDPMVAIFAAEELGNVGGGTALAGLVNALQKENERVRAAAARALGQIGGETL